MKILKKNLSMLFCFVIFVVLFVNVDCQRIICRRPNGRDGDTIEDENVPCTFLKCVPFNWKRGIWVGGFSNINKCCAQNGTLYEADSIIEVQTLGCEKRTVKCKMSSELEPLPTVVFETDNSKCMEGMMKNLMLSVSNISVQMEASSNNLINSMNASNVQVINRIEQNTLNIHEQQSANQTIMMNAIIDKIDNISWCEPPDYNTEYSSSTSIFTTTSTSPGGSTCNCGIPNKPSRIFGGNETDPNEYPWIVYLDIGGRFLCGGALISSQHVLTAAHCVDESVTAPDLRVYVGTHDRTDPSQIASVSTISINPSWTGSVYTGSDSAVLTLAEAVTFSHTVRPVCMSVDPSRSYAGQQAIASGWGLDDNNALPDNLREVNVEIISNDQCRNTWPNVNDEFHLCSTGESSSDFGTRGGDSGTLVFLEENGRYTGVGINSFNSDPDVFAKVTPDVKEWIQTIAETQDSDCQPGPVTKTTPTTASPTLNKTIELVGGSNRKEGNVLLYGKPVCDDYWGTSDAKVACRMLGFNTSTSYNSVARTHSTFGSVSTNFSINNVACTGSELSLFDCYNSYYGNCNENEGAGVICEYEPPSNTTVELVGGNETVGNVLLDGRPICDYSWSVNDARVICRMLGLNTLVAIPTFNSRYGDVGNDYILSYVGCFGSEEHIGQCVQGPGSNCANGQAAGVMCIPPGPTSDTPVQLVGGSDDKEGNVKIYGQPIYQSNWDNKDASVICRMLGFNPSPGASSVALTYSSFGLIDIWNYNLTNVQCTGSEQSIFDCPSTSLAYGGRSGSYGAGVMCDFTPPSNTTIELVGGNNTKEGNVLLNGSPICDDYWDTMDAQVICRMLGFDPTFSVATIRSAFGAVSNYFIMDDVACEGDETNILLCIHTKRENCGSTEGAGVICEAPVRALANSDEDRKAEEEEEEARKKALEEELNFNERE